MNYFKQKYFVICILGVAALQTYNCKDSSIINEENLAEYVRFLSSDEFKGRESGKPEAKKTAEYIAAQYKDAGLYPAFGDSYISNFTFKAGMDFKKEENVLEWRPPLRSDWKLDKKHSQEIKFYHQPIPFSTRGDFAGEFIFAGYCLKTPDGNWDDFKNLKIKNKIILCLRYGPGGKNRTKYASYISFKYKYNIATKLGVKAVVFLNQDNKEKIDFRNLNFKPSERKPGAVFSEGQQFSTHIDYLKFEEKNFYPKQKSEHLGKSLGYIKIKSHFNFRENSGYNVGAYLRPPDKNSSLIILGGHYDHIGLGHFGSMGNGRGKIHNGADDNASGTAAVLSVALNLKKQEEDKSAQIPTKIPENTNILFLNFDAEERGLIGSRKFVNSPHFDQKRTKLMINLDMVGRLRQDKGLQIQGGETGDPRFKRGVNSVFAGIDFGSKIPVTFTGGGHGPSDHSSFYSRKIPVLFISTGTHSEYHTYQDDFELINLKGLAKISLFVRGLLTHFAGLEKPIVYKKAKEPRSRMSGSYKVRLGIIPGSYGGGDGLEVGDVRPEAPIKKTGIRSGDKIISIGGKRIRNINDLMDFLKKANAKSTYPLVFLRGDKKIDVKTKLMPAN